MVVWFWLVSGFIFLFGFVVFWGAPYVPSMKKQVIRAFTALYPLTKDDVLVDLGSGDGVVLRQALRCGARSAYGVELNPALVAIAYALSRRYSGRMKVSCGNMWRYSFPEDTTVAYIFGEGRDIHKVQGVMQRESNRLNRKLYLVSYGFQLKNMQYDKKEGAHFLYTFSPLQQQKT